MSYALSMWPRPTTRTPPLTVKAAPRAHLTWLEARAGCVLSRQARAIEAVDAYGRVLGMVGFDGWTPSSAQMHVAMAAPLVGRRLLHPAFAYPFEEAGKTLLLCAIPVHNWRSLRLVQHLGFRMTHRITDGWAAGEDLLLHEMRREECRWLKGAHNGIR